MRIALSQPVPTAVTALIVAAVSGVIVSTTGQTVAIERDVLSRIDDAGTRTIIVEDVDGGAELGVGAVERINALPDIEWAVGFGIATDARPRGLEGAPAVAIRAYYGPLPDVVTTSAWDAQAGAALVGVDAIRLLGFETAAGPIQASGDWPEIGVVGWLDAGPPLEFLNRSLVTAPAEDGVVIRIIALAVSAQRVPRLSAAIASVLDPVDASSIAIQTSDSLVEVRAAVEGELGTFGRNIVSGTLAAGLVLTALNVSGAVTARRRDFGRRRALGASRFDIVWLVTVQTVATATAGAVAGAVTGTVLVHQLVGSAPQLEFTLAVAMLAVMASAIAAVPPALVAAYRDPVRVLRVP
jgi:putative ABC transport system permease protein